MRRVTSRVPGRTTKGLAGAAFVAATATAAAAAAALAATPVAQTPAGSLTFATRIVYGVGTGTVSSPAALCDVRPDGTRLERRSDEIELLSDPAWTRDGAMLAFVAYDDAVGQSLLRVTAADSWRPRTVARGQLRAPAWSPDGRQIAFESRSGDQDTIRVVNVDGTGERLLAAAPAASPTWSPDGTRIAFSQPFGATSTGIWTINADGSGRTKLTDDGVTPAWSPDGTRIAFVAGPQAGPLVLVQQELFTVAPDGTTRVQRSRLVEPASGGPVDTFLSRPAWSPDGSAVAVVRTRSLRSPRASGTLSVELFLVGAHAGTQTRLLSLDAIESPAWRPGASGPATATRPCVIRADATTRRVRGTAYDDLIVGTAARESFDGRAGNDWIHAGDGRDSVSGGNGSDEIRTGRGPDTVLTRDRVRDMVRCGEGRSDVGTADRRDRLLGSCRRVRRR